MSFRSNLVAVPALVVALVACSCSDMENSPQYQIVEQVAPARLQRFHVRGVLVLNNPVESLHCTRGWNVGHFLSRQYCQAEQQLAEFAAADVESVAIVETPRGRRVRVLFEESAGARVVDMMRSAFSFRLVFLNRHNVPVDAPMDVTAPLDRPRAMSLLFGGSEVPLEETLARLFGESSVDGVRYALPETPSVESTGPDQQLWRFRGDVTLIARPLRASTGSPIGSLDVAAAQVLQAARVVNGSDVSAAPCTIDGARREARCTNSHYVNNGLSIVGRGIVASSRSGFVFLDVHGPAAETVRIEAMFAALKASLSN